MDLDVQFFTGKYNKTNDTFTWQQLEQTIGGDEVKYRKCTGLESKGKIKNVYTETYADASVTRVDFPNALTFEPTEVVLDIVVKRGATANTTAFDTLVNYFHNGLTVFWDTQRKRCAVLLLTNAVEVKEDTYLGMNYLECEFKFQNIAGKCDIINDTLPSHANVEANAKPIILAALS